MAAVEQWWWCSGTAVVERWGWNHGGGCYGGDGGGVSVIIPITLIIINKLITADTRNTISETQLQTDAFISMC